ncbi:MAG TPA: 3-phosphoshikimate 1-carboxyvinyltransferase [Acidimicrobiales bacterium]|nr:3-phosphoshikimate 1-carboxyvinyltransferase [Acidimicrobiales bacterium]
MSAAPLTIQPLSAPPDVDIRVPGSKSITNRALVAAALADGVSTLRGVLFADDTDAMIDSLQRLGVRLDVDRDAEIVVVHGTAGEIPVSEAELDARQSGTTARFLLPVLSLGRGRFRLDGDAQLRARPLGPGIDALRRLGVGIIEEGVPGHLPVVVEANGLEGGSVSIDGAVSSQFLSGLMLAAPCARGEVTIEVVGRQVSQPYVEMTAAIVEQFGGSAAATGYIAADLTIEPDASAASYFFAAAAITGGRVTVPDLGSASLQGDLRFVDVLWRMGAEVDRAADSTTVRGRSLDGGFIDLSDLSDTAPTLAVVAPFASSPTEVTGIGFIRAKESDRVHAVVTELHRCGIAAEERDDGFVVQPGTPHAATVETYGDHRMAMAFALLGLVAPGIAISDPDCVAKTFPDYWARLEMLRARAG